MRKCKIIIILFILSSCSKQTKLTKATYIIFYSNSIIDTIHVSTYGEIEEDINNITDHKEGRGRYPIKTIYNNTAPYKRIYFKQTIIK